MNILHFLESLDPKGGGLPASVKDLQCRQIANGNIVDIVTKYKTTDSKSEYTLLSDIKDKKALMSNYNVVHIHGVWDYSLLEMAKKAKASGCKVIVSFHGQLMPNLLCSDTKFRKFKKIVYKKIILDSYIKYVDVIHSVCPAERAVLSKEYPDQFQKSIYNYVDASLIDMEVALIEKDNWSNNKVITFLGRVEPRKGVLNLIHAVVDCFESGYTVNIVGPVEDEEFLKKINEAVDSSNSKCKINIFPALYGSDKIDILLKSHFVCLPSYSEVVGLVNIEASLLKRCVITTYQANIDDIGLYGGFLMDPTIDSISKTLTDVSELTYEDYSRRCLELHNWSLSNFHYSVIDKQWQELLNNLID